MNQTYQSGFVSIVGCPNVGKSTLLNAFIGQKVSIVTDRAQTTRNKITGVLTRKHYQLVFLDTPGITQPRNKLGDYMYQVSTDALNEVEAILFVTDATQGIRERDEAIINLLGRRKAPVFAVINKCDAASLGNVTEMQEKLNATGIFHSVYKVSALNATGLEALEDALAGVMPEGPQYFPEDMVTDQPERIICGEIIREKALMLLREEVPHGIGVSIDKMEMREDGTLMDVWATLYCERESHKGIIIGKGGSMLKKIGQAGRQDIEWLLGVRVNLQIWVKIKEDWRNKPAVLHELGYE